MYYKHSGRFTVGGLAVAVATGGAGSLILAYAYAHGIILISEARAAALATLAFGALVGVCTGYGLIWGKVRNEPVGLAVIGAVSALALYISWAIWVPAIFQSEHLNPIGWAEFAKRPRVLWQAICFINQYGTWTLGSGGEGTKGWALWGIWALEAVSVVAIAVSVGFAILNHRPFCERCGIWCSRGAKLVLAAPRDVAQLKLQMEAHDLRALDSLGPGNGGVDHLVAVLDSCGQCRQFHTMSLTHVTIRRSKMGKPTVTNKMIVQHMVLDAGQAETLRQLSMKVTAKTTPPQVNTAAAGKR